MGTNYIHLQLHLPLKVDPNLTAMADPEVIPSPLRVPIADDDLAQLETWQSLLERSGYFIVDTAENVDNALQKLTTNVYDIVLADLYWHGHKLGPKIVELAATQPYTPACAFITGYPEGDELFGVPVLHKPIERDALVTRLIDLKSASECSARRLKPIRPTGDTQKLVESNEASMASESAGLTGDDS